MATYDVADRSAIVTGAGSGIGAATAEVLAGSGASVLVVDLVEEQAQAVAYRITAEGGVAVAFAGDVVEESVARAMVAAAGELGPLKIAVNNAGIGGEAVRIADLSPEGWRRVLAVNLDAVFLGMREQIPAIIAAGGGAIGWAPPRRSPPWSPSWPATRPPSSPAATTSSTAATPPSDRGGAPAPDTTTGGAR